MRLREREREKEAAGALSFFPPSMYYVVLWYLSRSPFLRVALERRREKRESG